MVVLGDQVTKILHNSLFTFFTEQGKTGKNGTHGNENLATYFWYFGSFDKKRTYKKLCKGPGIKGKSSYYVNKCNYSDQDFFSF